jgi:hypothetical protein
LSNITKRYLWRREGQDNTKVRTSWRKPIANGQDKGKEG